ncbi:beta-lactamase family protein [Rhodococcus sp. BP-332]|uniref:serine hydrolase domain-containing protein n=1 Tax=Rhodococcus sp. BP-332 TaxID=2739447 RepID=UPI001C9AB01D|nr:serine hydrolase domain-containing protein [Rhodococcus sp. BP-332]MBY6675425.1 beta-lactamase family protein [Rhodococcus sp. BP-332]
MWFSQPQPTVYAQMSAESIVSTYLAETDAPAAAVAVIDSDGLDVVARGRGVDGQPLTTDTPLRLASLTKAFTATLAALLAYEGTLDLDRPVVSYVPTLQLADPRFRTITMRHLLMHRSGLTDTSIDVESLLRSRTSTDFVERLDGARLDSDPGREFRYCNVNYNLAAAVIERVTGRAFDDVLHERILAPLGMTSTTFIDPAGDPGRGWNELLGRWFTTAEPGGYGPGSGGLMSTAHDMGLWMRAQLGGAQEVIPAKVLETAQNPPEGVEYAMGWSKDDSGARVHSGNLFTATSAQLVRSQDKSAVVVLMNSASMVDMAYPLMQALDHAHTARTGSDEFAVTDTLTTANRIVAVALATVLSAFCVGLVRVRWWRHRTAASTVPRRLLRSTWLLVPLVVLLSARRLTEFVTGGRSVRWIEIAHLVPAGLLVIGVTAACGVIVFAARTCRR